MRIDRLKIQSNWKNLGDFSVDLDERRDVAVLIGRNGSAKSNLLEALITIFRNIDLKQPAAFSYSIDYELDGHKVSVASEADRQPQATVDGRPISHSDLQSTWTPRYVVGYYSGVSDRFDELFREHDRRTRAQTLTENAPDKQEFRQFICARPVHGLYALLAFYFAEDQAVEEFLREVVRIEAFDSALLVLHRPEWARGRPVEEFWGSLGPVRFLLERIQRHSLAPFRQNVRVQVDFARHETRELLYLYLPDINSLRSLAAEYGKDPKALFQALDTMRLSGLIEDFRVRVRIQGCQGGIQTRQLSEGEQQLLSVLGLLRFTQNAGSLYILDEPDYGAPHRQDSFLPVLS